MSLDVVTADIPADSEDDYQASLKSFEDEDSKESEVSDRNGIMLRFLISFRRMRMLMRGATTRSPTVPRTKAILNPTKMATMTATIQRSRGEQWAEDFCMACSMNCSCNQAKQ